MNTATIAHKSAELAAVVDPAEDRLLNADLAAHWAKHAPVNPRARWRVIATGDGGSRAVPDWDAYDAEREADGADRPGILTRDSVLLSGDIATVSKANHREPRKRFAVILTPAGSRIVLR